MHLGTLAMCAFAFDGCLPCCGRQAILRNCSALNTVEKGGEFPSIVRSANAEYTGGASIRHALTLGLAYGEWAHVGCAIGIADYPAGRWNQAMEPKHGGGPCSSSMARVS